ncbi:MAG: twin-arginine translocase TatA/TatE family subunit [Desulfococcus multivorans]|nr:twin-arginine translocase TatA/TatE family subunit [Desulfococcus multivorans]
MPEILLILAVALIVIGPKKLPDLAKSLGRAMIEFKRATSELKSSLEVDTDVMDVKKTFKDMDQTLKTSVDAAPQTVQKTEMSDVAKEASTPASKLEKPESESSGETLKEKAANDDA